MAESRSPAELYLDTADPSRTLSSEAAEGRGTSPLSGTLVTIGRSIAARLNAERVMKEGETTRRTATGH